ncbi:MAG: chloride channel protein [Lachnospiraceae bacterium]|jgi:H+/Cl- antiporter ClcA|nr:chloride channel protein [Lachnospiraceae bacterium]
MIHLKIWKDKVSEYVPEASTWFHHTTWNRMVLLIRWLLFSVITGGCLGLAGTFFGKSVAFVTELRTANPWILFGLPLGGILIVWMYQWESKQEKSSTNRVLDAIHAEKEIPIKTAPLIFVSTVLTHLFGGSAGREGAALQLGGSIGNFLGKCFRIDESDKRVVIMCGMSAAFSALFGTPMAAAVFSMEVVSVGIMHYAALVPCVLSSYIAGAIAKSFGMEEEHFVIGEIPELTLITGGKILILGFLCAAVSILFCVVLHKTEHLFQKKLPNPFLRTFVAGCLIIVLTLLLRTTDYLGSGMQIIEQTMEGNVMWAAFLLKILFTAVTLAGGFKGGEIVPTFFVGATFGCLMGKILHISPSLAAACGMTAVFCGVTNSPISSLLIGLEMFGFKGAPFLFLSLSVSYMQSGYYGLYHSQRIVYSKVKMEYINQNTKE